YAGVYVFGRMMTLRHIDHENADQLRVRHVRRQDQWPVLIEDHHRAYISFEKIFNDSGTDEKQHGDEIFRYSRSGAGRRSVAARAGSVRTMRTSDVYQLRWSSFRAGPPDDEISLLAIAQPNWRNGLSNDWRQAHRPDRRRSVSRGGSTRGIGGPKTNARAV